MERALVIGSSGGIGAALAAALAARGASVTGLSRRDGLDLREPAAVERVMAGLEGPFDAILLATGILAPEGRSPEKALREIDAGAMAEVMQVNALGPALVLRPRAAPAAAQGAVGAGRAVGAGGERQ
jgi:NAD(P)-dependent dehydrogenase (short-subunit alcohol dehydrogenase family)